MDDQAVFSIGRPICDETIGAVESIRMLVEQPELRRIYGERGLRMAERDHDAGRNAGTIFDLMRTLSDRRRAQPVAAGDDHAEMEA